MNTLVKQFFIFLFLTGVFLLSPFVSYAFEPSFSGNILYSSPSLLGTVTSADVANCQAYDPSYDTLALQLNISDAVSDYNYFISSSTLVAGASIAYPFDTSSFASSTTAGAYTFFYICTSSLAWNVTYYNAFYTLAFIQYPAFSYTDDGGNVQYLGRLLPSNSDVVTSVSNLNNTFLEFFGFGVIIIGILITLWIWLIIRR